MAPTLLKTQHTSLQYSDSRKQQRHDVEALFRTGTDFPIKTGTEAGPEGGNDNPEFLREFAKKYNHRIHFARSNWIAVDREIIKRGTIEVGEVIVMDNDKTFGPGHDTALATMVFNHVDDRVGRLAQACAHHPTKGQTPRDPNYWVNRVHAEVTYEWMRENARGSKLAFVNGDFNMPDDVLDWAFGKGWTSMADELKAWQNTGHGPIDGFASFDADRRVKAKRFTVLDDKELFMHSDHFVCRGVWEIGARK